ncbi:XRE family transcriptional regulator [Neisseria sp. Ec49-e6-T10]|uniref:XRE family transcriptional regulator n=1 Tax=Neisseria sp. Ec49-e6-T10 TaxID=3140744 RepID=UPI003EBCCEF1
MNTIDIADWVKSARQHKGLTQEELAFELGFSTKASISAMERGRSQPTFTTMLQISELCSYPLPYQDFYSIEQDSEDDVIELPLYIGFINPKNIGEVMLENSNRKMHISKYTLKEAQVEIENVIATKIEGNSLYPVIPDTSTVILDRSLINIVDGKLYGCIYGGLFRIRKVYSLPNNMIKLSTYNNIEYPDEFINRDELQILGKVCTWIVVYR